MELFWIIAGIVGFVAGVLGIYRFVRPQKTITPRQLQEAIEQAFNHYFGIARAPARQLVATSDQDRLRLLVQATNAQREHRHADAVELLKRCLRPGLPAVERASLNNLIGNSYMYMGQPLDAEPHYEEVLATAEQMHDDKVRSVALGNLGIVYAQRGEPDKARHLLEMALQIDQRMGNRLGQAQNLTSLGNLCAQRYDLDRPKPHELDDAEKYFKDALDLYTDLHNPRGQAAALANLGTVYGRRRSRDDLDKAEDYFEQALEIDRQIGNPLGQAEGLVNLGTLYAEKGEPEKAEYHLKKGLQIVQRVGSRLGQAKALGNLGLLERRRGSAPQALRYLRRARRIFAEVGASADAEKADELIRDVGAPSPPKAKPKRARKKRPPKKP
jgi:tetratricopeptide (TPR) repeat protein